MTGLLTRVMHDHADAAAAEVDVDEIISEGDRRVRRQRVRHGLVAAVLAGAVVAGASSVPLLVGGSHDPTAGGLSFRHRAATYAVGSSVHVGGHTFDVGRPVASLVQTDGGIVYTTRDGRVWHYDGVTTVEIGRAEGHRLRADDQGSLVAWVETAEDGHPQYVVHSTMRRAELARLDDDAAGPARAAGDLGTEVFAVDDGSVYLRRDGDLVRYDVPSDTEAALAGAEPGTAAEIVDVAYGALAYTVDGTRPGNRRPGIAVGQRPDPEGVALAAAGTGALSPDGRLLAADEHGTMAIYAADDGLDVTPTVDGYRDVVAYDWVGDDMATVLAVSDRRGARVTGDVLTCDVSDDACSVVSSFRDVAATDIVTAGGDPAH
ncbi:MAG TPA: hypothetical protein VFH10_02850 [Nocardioides sp.]|uniref:hypothetical protein n=1 Tax=Nocardioides sp. TaxID=35761 RepID=UPI002D7F0264|nr:hypothetical protein [Nocardioides sp.]HET6651551.1 hypothetical protein [Nocardioides sp.]